MIFRPKWWHEGLALHLPLLGGRGGFLDPHLKAMGPIYGLSTTNRIALFHWRLDPHLKVTLSTTNWDYKGLIVNEGRIGGPSKSMEGTWTSYVLGPTFGWTHNHPMKQWHVSSSHSRWNDFIVHTFGFGLIDYITFLNMLYDIILWWSSSYAYKKLIEMCLLNMNIWIKLPPNTLMSCHGWVHCLVTLIMSGPKFIKIYL